MPRFVFALESLLRHRKNVERGRQRDLALVQAQMQQLETELKALDQGVQESTAELRGSRLTGRLDLNYLAAHRRFVAATQRKAFHLVQRMALVQRQLEEARSVLTKAAVERKAMEKLRERHQQRWLECQNKREADDLDEMTTQLTHRQLADEPTKVQP